MFSNLRITIYELLGYFTPGMFAVIGLFVLGWAVFFPNYPVALIFHPLSIEQWLLVLAAFYIAGHVMQAASNYYPLPDKTLGSECAKLCQALAVRLQDQGVIAAEYKPSFREIYLMATCIVSQFGSVADQDVYVYREGFYRGTSFSMFVLAACLLVRSTRPGAAIRPGGAVSYDLPRMAIVGMALLCLITGIAFVNRYYRFAKVKTENALACALLINQSQAKKEKTNEME